MTTRHKQQALLNEGFASFSGPQYPDWAATGFFYAALHWSRAYLAHVGYQPSNYNSHTKALKLMKKHFAQRFPNQNQWKDVLNKYQNLYELSREARYDCPTPQEQAQILSQAQALFPDIKQFFKNLVP